MKSKKVKRTNKHSKRARKSSWFSWRNPRLVAVLVVFVAVGVLGGIHYLSPSHALADLPDFRMECNVDHFAPDDPIVFPGMPGASHMHSFYGNTTTNANTTPASLVANDSSCAYTGQYDRSAYWVPSVYYTNPDGSASRFSAGSQPKNST